MSALRFFVHRNPHPTQLSTRRWVSADAPTPAAPWIETTEADQAAWEAAQIAAGWAPQAEAPTPAATPDSASRESVLIELAIATASESLESGITVEMIEAHIASIPNLLARNTARLESERPVWRRRHPLIAAIGGALNPPVPDTTIDEVFRKAAIRDATPL